jgi:hypothetical protein
MSSHSPKAPTSSCSSCRLPTTPASSRGRPWQITVFSDETSHTYVGEAEQGETATVYAEHELSHVFYALLAKADNTHLYFFAGTPEKVLADFDFDEQELAWYQQVLQDLEEQIGLIKARQVPPIGERQLPKGESVASSRHLRMLRACRPTQDQVRCRCFRRLVLLSGSRLHDQRMRPQAHPQ